MTDQPTITLDVFRYHPEEDAANRIRILETQRLRDKAHRDPRQAQTANEGGEEDDPESDEVAAQVLR